MSLPFRDRPQHGQAQEVEAGPIRLRMARARTPWGGSRRGVSCRGLEGEPIPRRTRPGPRTRAEVGLVIESRSMTWWRERSVHATRCRPRQIGYPLSVRAQGSGAPYCFFMCHINGLSPLGLLLAGSRPAGFLFLIGTIPAPPLPAASRLSLIVSVAGPTRNPCVRCCSRAPSGSWRKLAQAGNIWSACCSMLPARRTGVLCMERSPGDPSYAFALLQYPA